MHLNRDLIDQDYSREESGEVDNLATTLNSLDEAETDDSPGSGQAAHQLWLEASKIIPIGVLLQSQHRPLEVILAWRHSLVHL